jgi:alpha-galactosidase
MELKMRFCNALQLVPVTILLFAGVFSTAQDVGAREVFHYDDSTRVFRIDAAAETYAFGVNASGELQSIYWGGRLLASDPLPAAHTETEVPPFESPVAVNPQEYAGWGGGLYLEPSLKITFPDGNRDLVMHYVSHVISADGLTVVLKDITRDIIVTLRYTVDAATGIIGRSASIENRTDTSVIVEQAAAGSYNLPAGDHYRLNYLTGRWAGEFQIQQRDITAGKTVLESRRGSTGHQNNPWFEIERTPSADEQHGDIWFGALAWSGSWSMTIEQDQMRQVHVVAGFNPFDFGYKLDAGKTLQTPVFYAGFTKAGKGEASRLMHRFELTKIMPGAPQPRVRPVLFNSWEVTLSDVNEANQEALAEQVAAIGVERFVMDDGWFGDRKLNHSGVGDWYVDPKKFPNGLKPLIDKVHRLGMDFGIWVEPEMVDPDSVFYREHPDWVLNFSGRPRSVLNDRLVLNLARKDVRDYVFGLLDGLLSHNDIAFIKWDYNRNWSEPGWPEVAADREKNVYVDYTVNLYSILRELRAKHPNVEIESCSGGGGRVDLGILGLADQIWTSDNTDPFERLSIQDGFTQAYSPAAMMTWVTGPTNRFTKRTTSLNYRFLSAMQGSLGIGADVRTFTPQEMAAAKDYVATYKQLRETIQHGSLYRLISPQQQSSYSVTESVSMDRKQAVVFTFLHSSEELYPFPTVRLEGLDPDTTYALKPIYGARMRDTPQSASGRYWMEKGITPLLAGDFQAAAFQFNAVAQ